MLNAQLLRKSVQPRVMSAAFRLSLGPAGRDCRRDKGERLDQAVTRNGVLVQGDKGDVELALGAYGAAEEQ